MIDTAPPTRTRPRIFLALAAFAVAVTSVVLVSGPAEAAAVFTTQGPKVTGALKVGSTLTTTFPTWNPTPTATGYRWSRDGVIISGATHNTYTLTAADYGHDIWASIIGARDGYAKASRTKDLGVVAIGDAPKATTNPVLHGAASIGSTLTVTTGGWSISGLSVRYQWLRNGNVVSGRTANSYAVTSADAGNTLAARVIVSKTGYNTASARSQVTGKIAAPVVTPTGPSFSGNGVFKVGAAIQPGTYYSNGSQSTSCYWARLSSSNTNDYIGNDFGLGQRIMTVLSSDDYIDLDGCGSWYRIENAGPRLAHIPANGVFKVGAQVGPGTWQASYTDGCYWGLLATTTDTYSNIIDNNYLDGSGTVTVQIPSSADAFDTEYCGTWTKIG